MKPLIEIINTDNEPNIIDQILTNNTMQQPINYCDIMALGFTAAGNSARRWAYL